jgi:hypothetical protein
MIRTALDTSAPFVAATGILGSPILAQAGINGITETELGKALLVIMALAVIVNQIWTVVEKIIDRVKSKPTDLSGVAGLAVCEERHKKIDSDIKAFSSDLDELKQDMREDNKGIHKRIDDILRAVSRVEGKINQ